jgi:hypothetical protein
MKWLGHTRRSTSPPIATVQEYRVVYAKDTSSSLSERDSECVGDVGTVRLCHNFTFSRH